MIPLQSNSGSANIYDEVERLCRATFLLPAGCTVWLYYAGTSDAPQAESKISDAHELLGFIRGRESVCGGRDGGGGRESLTHRVVFECMEHIELIVFKVLKKPTAPKFSVFLRTSLASAADRQSAFVALKSAITAKLGLLSEDVTVYATADPTRRLEAVDVAALSAGTKLIVQILDHLTLHAELGLDEKVVGGSVCNSLFPYIPPLTLFRVSIDG